MYLDKRKPYTAIKKRRLLQPVCTETSMEVGDILGRVVI